VKLALLIPVYGMMPFKFAQCLANLIAFTKDAELKGPDGKAIDLEIETFIISSSSLCASRHRLVSDAYLWGADYMLWMDADHVFPRDAFCRLWSRNKAVIGCNYARRCIPTAPTACAIVTDCDEEDHRNLVYTTEEKAEANEVEPVSHLGFGLCLMHRSVIDRLQLRAEELGNKSFLPLFVFEPCEDHSGMIGEDVYFFRKLRDAGFSIFCDHALSWEVGHIHEMIMTNAHALRQKQEWIEEGRQYRQRYSDKLKELEGADG
jgi:hypothetical protein